MSSRQDVRSILRSHNLRANAFICCQRFNHFEGHFLRDHKRESGMVWPMAEPSQRQGERVGLISRRASLVAAPLALACGPFLNRPVAQFYTAVDTSAAIAKIEPRKRSPENGT